MSNKNNKSEGRAFLNEPAKGSPAPAKLPEGEGKKDSEVKATTESKPEGKPPEPPKAPEPAPKEEVKPPKAPEAPKASEVKPAAKPQADKGNTVPGKYRKFQ